MGEELVEHFHCGQAPASVCCFVHDQTALRVFDVPNFVEDRLRFYRGAQNAPTERWSWALGQDMPESRQERRRLEKEKGIEFVSRDEKPEMPKPYVPEKGWLKKEIDKRGIRFGDYSGFERPMTREESERKLAAERPDWSESEAVTTK